jgi:hypothetical protein
LLFNRASFEICGTAGVGMVYRILRHTEQTEDPLRDLVAEVIIKCVQDGERDEDRIRECARNALKN